MSTLAYAFTVERTPTGMLFCLPTGDGHFIPIAAVKTDDQIDQTLHGLADIFASCIKGWASVTDPPKEQ